MAMSLLIQDFRLAARSFRAHPGFFLLSIVILGLGIGANTAIFSVLDAVWLRAVPYSAADRLVMVWNTAGHMERVLPGSAEFSSWQEQSDQFEALAGIESTKVEVALGEQLIEANVSRVPAQFFRALDERPLLGRLFTDLDERSDVANVVVISRSFWLQRVGGDSGVIGRTLGLRSGATSEQVVVVGVLPDRFSKLISSGIIQPIRAQVDPNVGSRRPVRVFGILREGVSTAQAQAALESRTPAGSVWRPVVRSARDSLVGADVGRILSALFIAVGLTLLVACANVANLLLARLASREREFAVRLALGATRRHLVRQLLAESLALSLGGAALGLILVLLTRDMLLAMIPPGMGFQAIEINARVLAFTTFAAVVTSLLAGMWPVIRLFRAGMDRTLVGSISTAGIGLSRGLIAIEVALALIVLIVAGVLIRGLINLVNVDPGFKPEGVITFRLAPPQAPSSQREGFAAITGWSPEYAIRAAALVEELRRLPSVEGVGGIAGLPFSQTGGATYTVQLFDQSTNSADEPWVMLHRIMPGYFNAMRIPVLSGRTFNDGDAKGSPGVVIVTDLTARQFWPGEDPLGKRLYVGGGERLTVVGVVGAVRYIGLDQTPIAEVYRPWLQDPSAMTFVVRSDDAALLRRLAAPAASLSGVSLTDVTRLQDHVMQSVQQSRFRAFLFTMLATLVLSLTVLGVAGLTAHDAVRRRKEIGIRIALGARPRQVLQLLVRQAVVPIGAGALVGCVAAWWATGFVERFLYEIPARDPLTFGTAAAILAGTGLAASCLAARGATYTDPAVTLRRE